MARSLRRGQERQAREALQQNFNSARADGEVHCRIMQEVMNELPLWRRIWLGIRLVFKRFKIT